MEGFFLCNGNETLEIMELLSEHDVCFMRFIGMVCTRKHEMSHLCNLVYNIKNTMLKPESFDIIA